MHLLSENEKIKSVISRYEAGYKIKADHGERKNEIWAALQKVDINTATAEQINEIFGKVMIRADTCQECEEVGYGMVYFDLEPESVVLCKSCLQSALNLSAEV